MNETFYPQEPLEISLHQARSLLHGRHTHRWRPPAFTFHPFNAAITGKTLAEAMKLSRQKVMQEAPIELLNRKGVIAARLHPNYIDDLSEIQQAAYAKNEELSGRVFDGSDRILQGLVKIQQERTATKLWLTRLLHEWKERRRHKEITLIDLWTLATRMCMQQRIAGITEVDVDVPDNEELATIYQLMHRIYSTIENRQDGLRHDLERTLHGKNAIALPMDADEDNYDIYEE